MWPATSAAAALNITIVKATAAGSVSVYPCGSTRSSATTTTFATGATVVVVGATVVAGGSGASDNTRCGDAGAALFLPQFEALSRHFELVQIGRAHV